MSEVLILIGVIMIVSGFAVFLLGRKRGVPNSLLWAMFPILHGLHEFADYILDELNGPFIVEQFEIFFSFAGAFVLLAATIEFNGAIPRPIGKLASLIGLTAVSYYIFIFPESIIESIENFEIPFGVFYTNPFRFFQGFFITLLSVIAIILTTLYLNIQAKRGNIEHDPKIISISGVAVVLLSIYAFFESLESENPIFITLRAISLAFFVVVPIYFILVNRVGLQRLIVINKGGMPLFVYNFSLGQIVDLESPESQDILLTAGFISAISSFSSQVLRRGPSFSIRSNKLYFIISEIGDTIYALQSLHVSRNLEKSFVQFVNKVNPKIKSSEQTEEINLDYFKDSIRESFSMYS